MPSKTLHILQRYYKYNNLFSKQQKFFFQFAYKVFRFPLFVVASSVIGGSLQGRAEGSRCRGSRLAERA